MVTELRTVPLKSNEEMILVRLRAPAPDWEERLVDLIAHKGEPWLSYLRLVLQQELAGLEVYFYLGLLEGEIVGNIMTTEATAPRSGILGNVFTLPAHRRKGICAALMAALTDDFRSRGGQVMTLGTGYDSPAFHIYARFGFRSMAGTGRMIWEAQPSFLNDYFTAGPTTVRDIAWPDWAFLDLLYAMEEGDFLRNLRFAQYGISGYEGLFPQLHEMVGQPPAQSRVLQKAGGEVVGHVTLLPDPRWRGSVLLLDVFIHPNFYQAGSELLAAVEFLADTKIQAYAEVTAEQKIVRLKERGLREEAVLRNQLIAGDARRNVVVLATGP